MAEKAEGKQPRKRATGKPFSRGQSGNPKGRPIGARNKTTLAIEGLFDGQAQALTQKAIRMALDGDSMALKLCMERVAPLRRGRPVSFEVPEFTQASHITAALTSVIKATADGQLTPDEASTVASILDTKRRAIETVEIERRLSALETQKGRR